MRELQLDAASTPHPAERAPGHSRLLLSERGKMVVLAMRDIEFVQAAAKHVKIHAAGRNYSFRRSLAELERRLDSERFVRIHRSTLLNVDYLIEMHPRAHGDSVLILKGGRRLTLSRRYRDRLMPLLR